MNNSATQPFRGYFESIPERQDRGSAGTNPNGTLRLRAGRDLEGRLSKRRYVSQSWGSTGVVPARIAAASSFEAMAKTMGLSPAQYESSLELKEWARVHKQKKFVPPDLLIAWGFGREPEL